MKLPIAILGALRTIPDHLMMPVDVLWAQVRPALMPQPDKPSFNQALRNLEDKNQIVRVTNEDSDKVKITAAGIARHEEALQ